jgi:hypothetical protein
MVDKGIGDGKAVKDKVKFFSFQLKGIKFLKKDASHRKNGASHCFLGNFLLC